MKTQKPSMKETIALQAAAIRDLDREKTARDEVLRYMVTQESPDVDVAVAETLYNAVTEANPVAETLYVRIRCYGLTRAHGGVCVVTTNGNESMEIVYFDDYRAWIQNTDLH